MKQQTADTMKDTAAMAVGGAGTIATWGLSEIAVVVSIMTGLATFLFMLSMVWLNIKKGKQLDKTGSVRPPAPPRLL